MSVFRFVLLTLFTYRLSRVLTSDEWPPTKRFREWVEERTGEDSAWTTLVSCPWCSSLYFATPVFVIDMYVWEIPLVVLLIGAAMALVGLLGTYDER